MAYLAVDLALVVLALCNEIIGEAKVVSSSYHLCYRVITRWT